MRDRLVTLFILLGLAAAAIPVSAQTPTPPPGPTYIVQPGDTLWDIAARFNASVTDIMTANNMLSQDIYVGSSLIIPGISGMSARWKLKRYPSGNLRSLSRLHRLGSSFTDENKSPHQPGRTVCRV
jgi:LysM repeat protein